MEHCRCFIQPVESFPFKRVVVTYTGAYPRTIEYVLSVRKAEGGELVLERTEGRVMVLAAGWTLYETYPDNEQRIAERKAARERMRQEREDRPGPEHLPRPHPRDPRPGRGYGL